MTSRPWGLADLISVFPWASMADPVLVLRALGLGDALTGVPALRGLRRLHRDRPLLLAAPAAVGAWFTDLGLVDGFVPTSGLDDGPPGRTLGTHDAVNLHGRGPQSHALLLAGRPRSLLAFAPPDGSDVAAEVAGLRSRCPGSTGEEGPPPSAVPCGQPAAQARPTGPFPPGPFPPGPLPREPFPPGPLPMWRADEHEVLRWCRLVRWAGGDCGPEDLRLEPPRTEGGRRAAGGRRCIGRAQTTAPMPRSPMGTSSRVTGARGPEPKPCVDAGTASCGESSTLDVARRRPSRPYVVLHPGAASGSRRWPVDRWSALARALRRHADVRLTGGPDERALCTRIASAAGLTPSSVTAGDLDLPGLLTLVAGAALLVCGDTGVGHVATATGTASVLLFGPVPPRLWGPAIDLDRHVCLWHGYGDGEGDPHADEPDRTLLRITPAEVLAAAEALLLATPTTPPHPTTPDF